LSYWGVVAPTGAIIVEWSALSIWVLKKRVPF